MKERLRDTLVHEMCHAASFLISLKNDNHGQIWRGWANKVNLTYRHIPRISISHSYEIKKKYIYKCQTCSNE